MQQLDLGRVRCRAAAPAGAGCRGSASCAGPSRTPRTCSRAPRRSPSRASARRGCAGRSPTGAPSGIAGVCSRISMIGSASSRRTRHEHARHHREVERHVALVAVAEVLDDVGRPLVRLGQQHAVGVARVDLGAHALQELRASPAGSRRSCRRARTGTARRRAGSRRGRGRARSAGRSASAPAPRDCRSSGRAGG